MRVEELCGMVMRISAEDADDDLPEGAYLVIPLPDTLQGSMDLMNDGQAGLDVLASSVGREAADLASEAAFLLRLGSAGVAAHTEAEA